MASSTRLLIMVQYSATSYIGSIALALPTPLLLSRRLLVQQRWQRQTATVTLGTHFAQIPFPLVPGEITRQLPLLQKPSRILPMPHLAKIPPVLPLVHDGVRSSMLPRGSWCRPSQGRRHGLAPTCGIHAVLVVVLPVERHTKVTSSAFKQRAVLSRCACWLL